MKKYVQLIVGAVMALFYAPLLPMLSAQSYDDLWKQLQEAERKSLPQTVIKLADQIYEKALKENNAGQLFKAYLTKESQQEELTPDSSYVRYTHMEAWVKTETDPLNRAVLHSLLAEMYADFLSNNAYALTRRTDLVEEVPEDIREWTANIFIQRIDAHAQASLEEEALLLQTKTDAFIPLVIQREGSKYYGHDLFHLLLKRALNAYEQMNVEEAEELKIERAEALLNRLMKAYEQSSDEAFILAKLDYWNWRRGQTEDTSLSELDALIAHHGKSELCAEVYLEKAQHLHNEGKYKEADKVCDEAIGRYPSYRRIAALKNLKQQMYQPSVNVRYPQFGHPSEDVKLQLHYANVRGVDVYVYQTALTSIPENYEPDKIVYKNYSLLKSEHFTFAEADLVKKEPILDKDTVLTLPAVSKPGVYLLRVVPIGETGMVKMDYMAASRLKLVSMNLGDGKYELTTIDGQSGHPVTDVQVTLYSGYGRTRKSLQQFHTDKEGRYLIQLDKNERVSAYSLSKGDDTTLKNQYLNLQSYYRTPSSQDDRTEVKAFLLTDRSLYRPGQTIYVKGILYNQKGRETEVKTDFNDELLLLDVNGQEISRQKVSTGDFGSFRVEFMLPNACLNGDFTLRLNDNGTTTNVRVEEYKRPTFEIGFNPITTAYRLGDEVVLTGFAKMLNGVSLQNLPVRYTVVRQEEGRYWRWGKEKPLVADSVVIDQAGNFNIPLHLQKDDSRPRVNSYYFHVNVTVTDVNGETQEASTTLTVSQKAYTIYADIPGVVEKGDSLNYTIRVENFQGEDQAQKVRYRLFRIESTQPDERKEVKVSEAVVDAGQKVDFTAWKSLPSARYKLETSLPMEDSLEEALRAVNTVEFMLYSVSDNKLGTFTQVFCPSSSLTFSETETADIIYGTSFKDTYVFLDIFKGNERLESRVLNLSDELTTLHMPYKSIYGEGITLLFFFVKNGEAYSQMVTLNKKYPEKGLKFKWEVFRDKLQPGQQEEWKLVIKDSEGKPAMAELLALMYDESLDKIYHRSQGLWVNYPHYYSYVNKQMTGRMENSMYLQKLIRNLDVAPMLDFDYFMSFFHRYYYNNSVRMYARSLGAATPQMKMGVAMAEAEDAMVMEEATMETAAFDDMGGALNEEDAGPMELANADASLRTNFAETAFFYPQLRTNEQGEVVISFTIPESLTRWSFLGYAHSKEMETGTLKETVTTAKDFMLRPNMPRFLRVGDKTQIAASVQNLSEKQVEGTVNFILFNPVDNRVYSSQKLPISVKAGETGSVNFGFTIPEDIDLMGIRMMANTEEFSDGEQHVLAVLSNKQYVIESVSMPIRGNQTRIFSLESLFNHHHKSVSQKRLTVEFTGNPAWYAVQALPSVSTPLHDNAIDWAISYYVNTLASHIANSQPRIQQVFNRWKNTDAAKETFISQLQKNAGLKEILLNESPWVLDAQGEADQRQRIATLFDLNQMKDKQTSALVKLQGLQNEDGGWSWYKGMRSSWYTTTFIVEQLARIPILTQTTLSPQSEQMQEKAFSYLHDEALDSYKEIQRWMKRDKNYKYEYLSNAMMDYLYLIAITGVDVPRQNKEAYAFFMERVPNNLTNGSLTCKAMSAVILKKAGQEKKANEFITSLKEHLVMEDELGAHFAFLDQPYAWGMLPIPTHVAVMEAFGEFEGNETLIEEMKIWLLKQKQTHGWNNSVATTDAVYALLCTGTDLLQNQGDVRISIGDEVIETLAPAKTIVPDLGYVKQSFTDNKKVLDAREAVVEKRDAGIAWGAVYAQYLSPMTDVTQQGAELNVDRKFYVERTDANGRKSLVQIGDKAMLKVGDMVVSRVTISIDRSMDFVQLKDRLASCFEPLNALSGYRWNQGIGYYVESEDAATNFFFDALGKGVYVLESRYRISRAGTYQVGIASMQCAYAPEYVSHSSGMTIEVE